MKQTFLKKTEDGRKLTNPLKAVTTNIIGYITNIFVYRFHHA